MTPEEQYQIELENHMKYYDTIKPNPDNFESWSEYTHADFKWSLERRVTAPNPPGYVTANND